MAYWFCLPLSAVAVRQIFLNSWRKAEPGRMSWAGLIRWDRFSIRQRRAQSLANDVDQCLCGSFWNGVLSETHLFSPTTITEARIGVNRIASSRLQSYANTYGIPQQFGIAGIPQFTDNGGLPTINISGLTQLGGSGYLPSVEYSTVGQFSDTLTENAGNHSINAGYIYQRLRFSVLQPPASRGNFYFSGNYKEVPNTTGSNQRLASDL